LGFEKSKKETKREKQKSKKSKITKKRGIPDGSAYLFLRNTIREALHRFFNNKNPNVRMWGLKEICPIGK
jgi:hypothetical protein